MATRPAPAILSEPTSFEPEKKEMILFFVLSLSS